MYEGVDPLSWWPAGDISADVSRLGGDISLLHHLLLLPIVTIHKQVMYEGEDPCGSLFWRPADDVSLLFYPKQATGCDISL